MDMMLEDDGGYGAEGWRSPAGTAVALVLPWWVFPR